MKQKLNYIMLALLALLFTSAVTVMESLNLSSLLDTDAIFSSANLLIGAVGAIVLVVVGFKLAAIVIRFVLNIFDTLRFN